MMPMRTLPWALLATCLSGQLPDPSSHEISLGSPDNLELHHVKTYVVNYRGLAALRVADAASANVGDAGRLA
jgi:hypothetical protein